MKGWQQERERRRAMAAARAAGGTIVGQPKVIARMLIAIMDDGSGRVAMPNDLDTQFALIGRALVAAISQQMPNAPKEELVVEEEAPKELGEGTPEPAGEVSK